MSSSDAARSIAFPDVDRGYRPSDILDALSRDEDIHADPEPAPEPPTAEDIERMYERARQEGIEQGHKEGFEQGREEGYKDGYASGESAIDTEQKHLQALHQQCEAIIGALHDPVAHTDAFFEQTAIAMGLAIARDVIGTHPVDDDHFKGLLGEVAATLPIEGQDVEVVVHPDDAERTDEALAGIETRHRFSVRTETSMTPGSVRALTSAGEVRHVLDERIEAACAQALQRWQRIEKSTDSMRDETASSIKETASDNAAAEATADEDVSPSDSAHAPTPADADVEPVADSVDAGVDGDEDTQQRSDDEH